LYGVTFFEIAALGHGKELLTLRAEGVSDFELDTLEEMANRTK
jgi:hypothetical protein